MKLSFSADRSVGWLVILVLLHGCAAATVIRKQPDFDEENKRYLSPAFQVETVTVSMAENSPASR
jgi:hypothetical protein